MALQVEYSGQRQCHPDCVPAARTAPRKSSNHGQRRDNLQ